ncbi:MAG: acyltransferase [Bacteroidia bacterium]|nr:acyltransferase [Bacteroidia bacterium]
MKKLLKLFVVISPWPIKRFLLSKVFGYEIHPSARIGLAWIFPSHLKMAKNSKFYSFSTAIHLDLIDLGENSSIGRGCWITGLSTLSDSPYFKHQPDRKAALIMGHDSHFTKNHHIDCTNTIKVGNLVTIAGYQSQFLTHSINIVENIQDSAPIEIGDFTFVGTNVVMLGGAKLPAYSVLGAKSLLNKKFEEEYKLYGGVPAKPIADMPKDTKYFFRTDGFVY